MTIGRMAWILGAAILVLVVNVAVSFLYVAIYSHLINPRQDQLFYQQYAEMSAPYSSIIAGAPLMFFMCWWVASWWEPSFGVKAAIFVWLVYAVIDVVALVAAGMSSGVSTRIVVISTISVITKLAAAYFGGILGSRHG